MHRRSTEGYISTTEAAIYMNGACISSISYMITCLLQFSPPLPYPKIIELIVLITGTKQPPTANGRSNGLDSLLPEEHPTVSYYFDFQMCTPVDRQTYNRPPYQGTIHKSTMPLTDSEATAGGFYVGVVGLALAAIEFVIVWWGRLRGLLVYVII